MTEKVYRLWPLGESAIPGGSRRPARISIQEKLWFRSTLRGKASVFFVGFTHRQIPHFVQNDIQKFFFANCKSVP